MSNAPGRHRAPSRLSTASLSDLVARTGPPVAKASAVLAVTGGLVATVTASASAAPLAAVTNSASPLHSVHQPAAPVAAPAAAPVSAVAAPAAPAMVASPAFGQIGFKGNTAPKPRVAPKPEPQPQVQTRPAVQHETNAPSRSSERTSVAEREAEQRAAAERKSAERAAAEQKAAERAAAERAAERRAAEQKAAEQKAAKEKAAQQSAPAPSTGGSGVLGIAARYVGTPYVFGGGSPSGFDCSGYTSYVFGQMGVSLSRTASGQQAQATRVSNPQPGDLVFFGYPAHHVGIYAGGGMMYDAGRPGVPVQKRAIFHSSGAVTYGRL